MQHFAHLPLTLVLCATQVLAQAPSLTIEGRVFRLGMTRNQLFLENRWAHVLGSDYPSTRVCPKTAKNDVYFWSRTDLSSEIFICNGNSASGRIYFEDNKAIYIHYVYSLIDDTSSAVDSTVQLQGMLQRIKEETGAETITITSGNRIEDNGTSINYTVLLPQTQKSESHRVYMIQTHVGKAARLGLPPIRWTTLAIQLSY